MENTRTQFTIPFGDGEPPNFFSKNRAPSTKQQATSAKQQAGGWAHRRQAFDCQDKNKFDIMGFSGTFSYDFAGPTMSRQNCFLYIWAVRPQPFARQLELSQMDEFHTWHPSWAEGICLEPRIYTKLEEIRPVRRSHPFPKIENRKATSYRRQASSVKRQAASIPAFGHRRVGGPTGYKLSDRGPWIKFHGSWSEGLD